jgi:antitoxin ParD1/3/4
MGKVEKISISLTGEMLGEVQEAVASGAYASTSEVVREALREWKARRASEQAAIEEVRELVREARAGGYKPFTGAEEVKVRGRARLKSLNRG